MKFYLFLILSTLPFLTLSTSLSTKKPSFSRIISSSFINITYPDKNNPNTVRFPACEIDESTVISKDYPNLFIRFKSPLSDEQSLTFSKTFFLFDKTKNEYELPYSYLKTVKCIYDNSGTREATLDLFLLNKKQISFHLVLNEEQEKIFDLTNIILDKIDYVNNKVPTKIKQLILSVGELKAYTSLFQMFSPNKNANKLTLSKLENIVGSYFTLVDKSTVHAQNLEIRADRLEKERDTIAYEIQKLKDKVNKAKISKTETQSKLNEIINLSQEEQVQRLQRMLNQKQEIILNKIEQKKTNISEHFAVILTDIVKTHDRDGAYKMQYLFRKEREFTIKSCIP